MSSNNNGDAKIAYFKSDLKKYKIKYSNPEYKNNTYYHYDKKGYRISSYLNRDKLTVAIVSIKNN